MTVYVFGSTVGRARAADSDIVEIPGIGPVDLAQLPADFASNIRRPDDVAPEPEPEHRDLPPIAHGDDDSIPDALAEAPRPPTRRKPAPIIDADDERARREEAIARIEEIRASDMPENAFRNAWEHILQMQPSSGPGTYDLGPAPQWLPAGPAGYEKVTPPDSFGAGIVKYIAIDRSSAPPGQGSQRLYLGTRSGGLWKSTDRGATWRTTTDDQPTLQIQSIAVHPTNPSVILAGTGVSATPAFADVTPLKEWIGILRSLDGGENWSRIGPTWCSAGGSDTACRSAGSCAVANPVLCPGTDPVLSDLRIKEIAIDRNPAVDTRAWAATSRGLWYSSSALDPNTSCDCSATAVECATCQVTWTLVTPPGVCQSGCLPASADHVTPEQVTHVFVSPLSNSILYVSVAGASDPGNDGWYRSADRGEHWTPINTGLPLSPNSTIQRAAIFPGSSGNQDTIYAIITGVPSSPECGPFGADGQPVRTDRLFRTTNSGDSWSKLALQGDWITLGQCTNLLSVGVHPTDKDFVVFGGVTLFRSINGGNSSVLIGRNGSELIHADQNAMAFDPNKPNLLYVGNDGGVWRTDMGVVPESWVSLYRGLANLEFNNGATIDSLNYGRSAGGTQDNGYLVGAGAADWTYVGGGDGVQIIIDPTDSNIAYFNGGAISKTADGGASLVDASDGLPDPASLTGSLALDPGDHNSLVVYSANSVAALGQTVYRTTTGATRQPSSRAWLPISRHFSVSEIGGISRLAIAPSGIPGLPSNLIFAATSKHGVWRTMDASTWDRADQLIPPQLPARSMTSIEIDAVPSCSASDCTLYVTTDSFNDGQVPGHVFRSKDVGATWSDVSGACNATHPCPAGQSCTASGVCTDGLPDVPVNDLVIARHCNPIVLYVATDMGVFEGMSDGGCGTPPTGGWTWRTFTQGMPRGAVVRDLVLDRQSGVMRAFTYGRSAWEIQALPPANPDVKVNDVEPATDALPPRISTGDIGFSYALAWADDRLGANNWHAYFQALVSTGTNPPVPQPRGQNVRVDDSSSHVVQTPAVASYGLQVNPISGYVIWCAFVTWIDDRVASMVAGHVYYQYVCNSGYTMYLQDQRADTSDLNARAPVITRTRNTGFVIAWIADRGNGTGRHDVYARYFDRMGQPQGGPFKANSSSRDVTAVAIVGDTAGDGVFIAWSEAGRTTSRIKVGKFAIDGRRERYRSVPASGLNTDPSVAALDSGDVVVAWHRSRKGEDTVMSRRLNGYYLRNSGRRAQVNRPPGAPLGGALAFQPSVAANFTTPVSPAGNYAVAWQAGVNGGDMWSALARSFDGSDDAAIKNDFRVDLKGRATTGAPRVGRGVDGTFPFAWRDNRDGHFDVYTRVMTVR